jgi:hypothetical protein
VLRAGVLALLLFGVGCATTQQRFVRTRIRMTPWCSVTLIRDVRTNACFIAYSCGGIRTTGGAGLAAAPKEVCEP